MTVRWLLAAALAVTISLSLSPVAQGQGGPGPKFTVVPFEFDPGKTDLVKSTWLTGIGCPTGATILTDPPSVPPTFTDPACPTGDPGDKRTEGLLLVKTGPQANIAAAGADLKGVKGTALTELGYDIRKPGSPADDRGSHCGAGAPRFNVVIAGVTFFIGCNSPPADVQTPGLGWLRLRWGGAVPLMAFGPSGLTDITGLVVDAITIIFDEGQDIGPDNFGAAVLDNVDVNGHLVGRGPSGGK